MKPLISSIFYVASLMSFTLSAPQDLSTPPKDILALLHDHTPLPPTQVFDNLYCIGTKSVVAWVLQASQGLILIDSMWNDEDAKLIQQGLKTYGLDAKEIKLIIITHGHGDHYGGASYLAKNMEQRC